MKQVTPVNIVDCLEDQGLSRTEARRRIRDGAVSFWKGEKVEKELVFVDAHSFPLTLKYGKRNFVRIEA